MFHISTLIVNHLFHAFPPHKWQPMKGFRRRACLRCTTRPGKGSHPPSLCPRSSGRPPRRPNAALSSVPARPLDALNASHNKRREKFKLHFLVFFAINFVSPVLSNGLRILKRFAVHRRVGLVSDKPPRPKRHACFCLRAMRNQIPNN